MSSGVPTNRTNVDLPADVSEVILSKVQESSKVMSLARQMPLPGRGAAINVLLSDPEAAWADETAKKKVSNPNVATKILRGYTLAVIVPFSNQFRRDEPALYDAIVEKLPDALGRKFDETVFFGSAPGSDFDTLANVTKQSLASDVYQGLVAADTDIALHGGISNGYIFSAQGKGLLLGATDTTKRPIFNAVTEKGVPVVLGQRTEITKAAFKSGSPSTVGFTGDWTQAVWGMVDGVKINFSEDASLTLADNSVINLFERNMFAVRAEIEVGFRALTDAFNALTASGVPSI
jgi:HK97 family phage major capsid protein